ncbi:serine/threonine-protein kinase D2-like isoform X2 [Sycon ciliatum]|uniref:serine/threonine-protein kinase D2-like isoform X2 n=1 Tax=Sycon ciliatum TaxID=27933 RepID=UPI0031F6D681
MESHDGISVTFQCGLFREQQLVATKELSQLRQQALIFLERKYPDHPYINLSGSLTLCVVDSTDNADQLPFRRINSVSDLKNDCIVGISLSTRAQVSETRICPHSLSVHSYRSPAFCDFCGQMLFGLIRQGLKCSGCGYNYHKRCAYKIPNDCSGRKSQQNQHHSPNGSISTLSAKHYAGSFDSVSSSSATMPASVTSSQVTIDETSSTNSSTMSSSPSTITRASPASPPALAPRRSKSWSGRPPWIDRALAGQAGSVQVPHTFVVHSFKRPTVCMYCRRLLVGVFRQGMRCKDCKYNVHRRCMELVQKNCTGEIIEELLHLEESGRSSDNNSEALSSVDESVDEANEKHAENASPSKSNNGSSSSSSGGRRPEQNGTSSDGQVTSPIHQSGTSSSSDKVSLHVSESNTSSNIPLMRIAMSANYSKRSEVRDVIKEGWVVHFTSLDPHRKLLYWRLDARTILMYKSPESTRVHKEIALSNILMIGVPTSATPVPPNSTPHCFEFNMPKDMVFYVGERVPSLERSSLLSNGAIALPERCSWTLRDALKQAVGEQQGTPWEKAIRAAFMPVTPKPSVKTVVSVTESASPRGPPSTDIHNDSSITQHPDAQHTQSVRQYESPNVDISIMYQIFPDEPLGSGQFGIVYAGVHRLSGRQVAVKVIDKLRFPSKQESALKNEVAILHSLNHPGVVNLERMFETPDRVFVVMEKMEGDMLEMILSSNGGRLSERTTRFLVFQILIALQHLHSKNIVHCDLKPENVLLKGDMSMPQIKLCDFGFARIIGEKGFRKSVVGTPAYLAPEVLSSKGYNRSLDMWSVGVITYVSLSGTFPFNEDEEIADQIKNAAFMYPENPWGEISKDAIELINCLLQVNQKRRYTVVKALHHTWLQTRQTWLDLRGLEGQVGHRYLTHPVEDAYWQSNSAIEASKNPAGGKQADYFAQSNRSTTTIDERHEGGHH